MTIANSDIMKKLLILCCLYVPGAICVSLHTMSKSSKGLFQNAVMLSGSALNPMIPRSRDHLPLLYSLGNRIIHTI